MTHATVRKALETAVQTWATSNTQTVQWENTVLDPEPANYVRVNLLPAPTEAPDIEQAGSEYVGVFQVSIVRQIGEGPGPAEALAASLQSAIGMRLTSGSVVVNMRQRLSPAPPLTEPGRYVLPCSAGYTATVY